MSLTVWDLSVTRDTGGERWKWPRIEWPKVYRYPDVLAEAKAAADPCDRSFELLGAGEVRVRYCCGKVVEFGNLPPWPANDAVFAARLPNAPHPHENAEMRWPRR